MVFKTKDKKAKSSSIYTAGLPAAHQHCHHLSCPLGLMPGAAPGSRMLRGPCLGWDMGQSQQHPRGRLAREGGRGASLFPEFLKSPQEKES